MLFVLFGIDYSGAEIVLHRYLKSNPLLEAYIVTAFQNTKIIEEFSHLPIVKDVASLNFKYSIFNRITPVMYKYIFEKKISILLKRLSIDIVYLNNSTELMVGSLIKKKNPNVKVVAHIHDMINSFRNPLRRMSAKKSLKYTDKIIAVSKASQKELSIYNDNVSVVYNGIDKSFFTNQNEKRVKLHRIGFIGSFTKRKGVDILINSIQSLITIDGRKDLSFTFALNKTDDKLLSKYQETLNNLRDNINVLHNLNEEDIKKLLGELDILVVPSRRDPLPTVIMEAMASGVLPIGSIVDGIPEMIGEDGLLFTSESEEELKASIINYSSFSEEKINVYRNKVRMRAEKLFSEDNKLNSIQELLSEIKMNGGDQS